MHTYLFTRICLHSCYHSVYAHECINVDMRVYTYVYNPHCICAYMRVHHSSPLKYAQKVHLRESVYVANSYLRDFCCFSNSPASTLTLFLSHTLTRVK